MIAVALLLLLSIVRLAVAASVPLAPDEAYYWVWSRALQGGYLDHPPMVALWIRLGTSLVGDTAFGVRLLAPAGAFAGSLLLADAAERLWPGRRLGVPAAVLLNATLIVGVGSVTMTPDTPLLFFAVVSLWALVRAVGDGRWFLVAGVAMGAAMASKYTGVLLGFAVPVWLFWTRRDALRSIWPWAGGLVAVAVFSPVILWNAEHGWASFLKQGGRAGDWQPARAVQFVAELVAGQIGLATPAIFVLFAAGLWRAGAGAWRRQDGATLLAALAVPGLLVFAEHALGDRVQANWLAVLYPPLALAAARVEARWWRGAAGFGLALTAVAYVQASTAVLALPKAFDPTLVRLAGWDDLARQADALRRRDGLAFLASEEYSQASELAWWSPSGPVIGAERRWVSFDLPDADPDAGSGLLLMSERRREEPDSALWESVERVGDLVRGRAGVEAERFRVYRVQLRTGAPAKSLPRPGGE